MNWTYKDKFYMLGGYAFQKMDQKYHAWVNFPEDPSMN